jgi:HEAT repeat protein
LNYEPEEWRKKLGDAVGEPAVAVGGAPVLRALAGQRAVHAGVALTAFEILGPEATSAVPALVSLLGDWQSASRCGGVLYALMFIGEAGLPPLIATVTNTSVPIALRCNAAQRIGAPIMNLGTNADWAVPILLTCLDNTDFGAEVAGTLGNLGRRPELVLPALQKCLRDGDLMMRVKAAEALGHFGKEAIAAVPDLLAVTGRHDALATEATNALLKIAPEALK